MAFCVRGELFLFRQTSSRYEGGGEGGAQGQRGGKGCGDPGLPGQLSEGVKACRQTVGGVLQLIHTGAYNLQPVINHCCVWGRRLV